MGLESSSRSRSTGHHVVVTPWRRTATSAARRFPWTRVSMDSKIFLFLYVPGGLWLSSSLLAA